MFLCLWLKLWSCGKRMAIDLEKQAKSCEKPLSSFENSGFLAEHYNLDISNFRFAILISCPTALLGRAAFAPYERFAAGKPRRRGGFAALSISIPKGGAALGAAEPKRKGHPFGCPFLLVEAGRVELPSENPSMGTSPGADGYCGSLALPVPVTLGKPSRPGVW